MTSRYMLITILTILTHHAVQPQSSEPLFYPSLVYSNLVYGNMVVGVMFYTNHIFIARTLSTSLIKLSPQLNQGYYKYESICEINAFVCQLFSEHYTLFLFTCFPSRECKHLANRYIYIMPFVIPQKIL